MDMVDDLSISESSGSEEKKIEKQRLIMTRGIPSSDVFYLPRHDSPEVRQFQNENEVLTRTVWQLETILNFVFPKRFRPKYYEISVLFMRLLLSRGTLEGKELSEFVLSNNISKATFYNRVLLRLKRIGMIKVERMTVTIDNAKRRPMRVSISKTFGNYLMKIADSWHALVDESRERQRKSNLSDHIE